MSFIGYKFSGIIVAIVAFCAACKQRDYVLVSVSHNFSFRHLTIRMQIINRNLDIGPDQYDLPSDRKRLEIFMPR